jgi:hypothetical protein
VVGDRNGLATLEMRVSGHKQPTVCFRQPDKSTLQNTDSIQNQDYLFLEIETEISSNLVVAATGGMELGSRITDALGQLLLDIHVDILELVGKGELPCLNLGPDLLETCLNGLEFFKGQKSSLPQGSSVGDTSSYIVPVESPVKGDGCPVIPEQVGHGFFETAVTHPFFLTLFDPIGNNNGNYLPSKIVF